MLYMVPLIFYTQNFVIVEVLHMVLHYIKYLNKYSHKWIKNILYSFSHGLINFRECPTQGSITYLLTSTKEANSGGLKSLWSHKHSAIVFMPC